VIRAGVHSDTGQNAANALDDTDHGGCDPGRHRPDRDVVMLLIVHVVGSMVCVMLAMLIRKQRLGRPTFVLGLPCSFLRNGWDARRLPFPHRGSHLLGLNNQLSVDRRTVVRGGVTLTTQQINSVHVRATPQPRQLLAVPSCKSGNHPGSIIHHSKKKKLNHESRTASPLISFSFRTRAV